MPWGYSRALPHLLTWWFEIIGADFAGPIKYRQSPRVKGKAYLVLYACSLSRALHLEVLPNQETTTFLQTFKHMVARRGRPAKAFSNNVFSSHFYEPCLWQQETVGCFLWEFTLRVIDSSLMQWQHLYMYHIWSVSVEEQSADRCPTKIWCS